MQWKTYLVFIIILSILAMSGCSDSNMDDQTLEGVPIGPADPEPAVPDPEIPPETDIEPEPAVPPEDVVPDDVEDNQTDDGVVDEVDSIPVTNTTEAEADATDANATESNETISTPVLSPGDDPTLVVKTYLEYMSDALEGTDAKYSDAYDLISPHSKKNIAWMASLNRFKAEATDTYEKYHHGGNITGYIETKEFGTGYKVYYEYEGGEVYYVVQFIDDIYYISSGSRLGSMFWKLV